MNIIFSDNIQELKQKYVVLELDTFATGNQQRRTAYAVVESIPADDFVVLDSYVKVHHDLLQAYRDRNWDYCRHAIQGLMGHWNNELDSFYQDLAVRVADFEKNPPPDNWDGSR